MCFHTGIKVKSNEEPQAKIATEDITCYKIINRSGSGRYYNPTDKNGKSQFWKIGFHAYVQEFRIIWDTWIQYGEYVIHEGLHSYKNTDHREICNIIAYYYTTGFKIIKLIIPQGALYYENDLEYVSNELIYVEDYIPKVSPLRISSSNLDYDDDFDDFNDYYDDDDDDDDDYYFDDDDDDDDFI